MEPPCLILQSFNFTILRRYLPRNSQFFTPWFVHWSVNKRPFQWFSCLLESTCHANVEIDNLDLLKYFNMRNDFFFCHFQSFLQRISDLSPRWAAIQQIWQPLKYLKYFKHLKYQSIELLLSALFEMFWNLPIRIWDGWIIQI